tara:strand:+ start:5571 stop:5732 length:162 start_codon:yes stop_codon:yes gene_type:complete
MRSQVALAEQELLWFEFPVLGRTKHSGFSPHVNCRHRAWQREYELVIQVAALF